tara:strand:- start:3154 stop:4140 length:987 start_codon:yes stop_codon:yes gene_type:complete
MMHRLQIAPMMGYTHRHYRYLMRRLCPDALLYSEMITTGALLFGDAHRYLAHDATEQPVALQLGGNDPSALAQCASMAVENGYTQINLNVGCPSSRVKEGGIGASLYRSPQLVAECVTAMCAAVSVPVTVKCRIGVDDCDQFDYLVDFANKVDLAGAAYLVVHARKAWLSGLNPKQNRTIPPLRYDVVRDLSGCVDIPIVLNGGLTDVDSIKQQLDVFPGVMVGRYACSHPLELSEFSRGGPPSALFIADILKDYFSYMSDRLQQGDRVSFMIQPLHGFFRASRGAKRWRSLLGAMQTGLLSGRGTPADYFEEILAHVQLSDRHSLLD